MEIKRKFGTYAQYLFREEDDGNYVLSFHDGEETVVEALDIEQVETLIKDLGLIINRSVTLEEI